MDKAQGSFGFGIHGDHAITDGQYIQHPIASKSMVTLLRSVSEGVWDPHRDRWDVGDQQDDEQNHQQVGNQRPEGTAHRQLGDGTGQQQTQPIRRGDQAYSQTEHNHNPKMDRIDAERRRRRQHNRYKKDNRRDGVHVHADEQKQKDHSQQEQPGVGKESVKKHPYLLWYVIVTDQSTQGSRRRQGDQGEGAQLQRVEKNFWQIPQSDRPIN